MDLVGNLSDTAVQGLESVGNWTPATWGVAKKLWWCHWWCDWGACIAAGGAAGGSSMGAGGTWKNGTGGADLGQWHRRQWPRLCCQPHWHIHQLWLGCSQEGRIGDLRGIVHGQGC